MQYISNQGIKLIIQAFFYGAWIRFLMVFVKFSWYESLLGKRNYISPLNNLDSKQQDKILHIQQIIYSVGKYTPWQSKCLVKALSAKWILANFGIQSTIYFGIRQHEIPEGKMDLLAHAWLKVGDQFITGKRGYRKYKVVNFYS
jgi:hypothetical protein